MPDIIIAGATFHDVPQIDIPKDGGGTASFMFESGTKSITENGTHDVSGFASAEVNVSGGGTPVIEALSVTQNGTYTAPSGVDGYSPVTVNVSGGGGSDYTLLYEAELTATHTSASETRKASYENIDGLYDKDKIIVVHIRDKAGPRTGYFYESYSFFVNAYATYGTSSITRGVYYSIYSTDSELNKFGMSNTYWGLYARTLSASGSIQIYARYSADNSRTIDGTYDIKIYALNGPGGTPFPS